MPQVDIVNEGLVTADGRPCTLQLPEGLALESDSVDLDDVECVPTMSDDGRASALPLQANAAPAGARAVSWGPGEGSDGNPRPCIVLAVLGSR